MRLRKRNLFSEAFLTKTGSTTRQSMALGEGSALAEAFVAL
jgi:hypothetical protein